MHLLSHHDTMELSRRSCLGVNDFTMMIFGCWAGVETKRIVMHTCELKLEVQIRGLRPNSCPKTHIHDHTPDLQVEPFAFTAAVVNAKIITHYPYCA